jgi:hypothetical protein
MFAVLMDYVCRPLQVFQSNSSEPATLSLMMDGLQGKNSLVGEKPISIMDAGIVSADNIAWFSEHGYLYLVVSRERDLQDPGDQDHAILVLDTGEHRLRFPHHQYINQGNPALLLFRSKSQKRTGHPQPLPRSSGRRARQTQCRLGQ